MSDVVCMQCKYIGKARLKKRGSAKLDFLGWLVFPLGVPYTLWRMLAVRTPVCKHCGNEALVAADSVAGERLVKIAMGEIGPQLTAPETPRHEPPPASKSSLELDRPPEKKARPPQDPNVW
jgi:hypothetical protein